MADLVLKYTEDAPLTLRYTEAKIKPEQDKTVTPDYDGFTVLPDPGATLGSVTVNPIPDPTDVKSISANGDYDVRRFGTAHVAVPEPSGTIAITENGQHPVAGFAVADVDVPQGVFPVGKKIITENGTYDITNYAETEVHVNKDPAYGVIPETIDANGNYCGHVKMYGYNSLPNSYCTATVKMMQSTAETIEIISNAFDRIGNNAFENHIALKTFIFPESTRTLGQWMIGSYSFRNCPLLETIIVRGNITFTDWFGIPSQSLKHVIVGGEVVFATNPRFGNLIELLDFRGCTSVPTLPDASWLQPSGTCRLICKQSLVTEWQNATNWSAVPNLIWEGI